jgi:hypothetical protein
MHNNEVECIGNSRCPQRIWRAMSWSWFRVPMVVSLFSLSTVSLDSRRITTSRSPTQEVLSRAKKIHYIELIMNTAMNFHVP